MAFIGNNKHLLIEQIKTQCPNINEIQNVLSIYDDLSLEDLRGVISDEMYTILADEIRDPQEKQLWEKCNETTWCIYSLDSIENINSAISCISTTINDVRTYISRYSNSPKYNEANTLYANLLEKKEEFSEKLRILKDGVKEEADWNLLEKGNYSTLRNYLNKYPNSIHKDEIDDLMWTNTKNAPSLKSLERYLQDLPTGQHANEAQKAIEEYTEWEEVKRSKDLFLVDDYRDNHSDSPFKHEINNLYHELRDELMEEMENNPSKFRYSEVQRLIQADIFKDYELIDKELMSEESWDVLKDIENIKDTLPHLQDYQINSVEGTAPGATDVFLFGTPGTGKTCMLMGLVGANGGSYQVGDDTITYKLNLKKYGGEYAAALQEFIFAGITPGSTYGSFVTTFHGEIAETSKKGKTICHPINLVEMSGEEFARRIIENPHATVSFEDMGTGATRVMSNNNRKIFFIIVDPTVKKVKIQFEEDVLDDEGNVIDRRIRQKYLDQRIILSKFVSLFELPENQDIMNRVDAIHFIVTKSDTLDKKGIRGVVAAELLKDEYISSITPLKQLCQRSRRINRSTNYSPMVFTFSLGKFYLGDIFEFDPAETQNIINAIRVISSGKREESVLDKLKKLFG